MRHVLAFSLACAVFGAAHAGSMAGAPPADKGAAQQAPEYLIKNTPAGDTALARLKSRSAPGPARPRRANRSR